MGNAIHKSTQSSILQHWPEALFQTLNSGPSKARNAQGGLLWARRYCKGIGKAWKFVVIYAERLFSSLRRGKAAPVARSEDSGSWKKCPEARLLLKAFRLGS
jgi:hypothetical protein